MTSTIDRKPAIFIDRDNTLIADPGYLRDAAQVRLLDGAADAIRRFRSAGYEVIVATNQSGVARGLMTEEDVQAVHRRLRELLSREGADTDAIYYCPYLDGLEATREAYRRDSELRKPKPGMLLLAARERGIDLSRSWMIGDSPRDVLAGRAAGCRTVLIGDGDSPSGEGADYLAPNLIEAAELVLNGPSPAAATQPRRHVGTTVMEGEAAPALQRSEALLEQIVEELRIDRRERHHDEFSLAHLAGAVVQAFALCAIGWGIYGAISNDATAATLRLLAGLAFQTMALTFFMAGKRR